MQIQLTRISSVFGYSIMDEYHVVNIPRHPDIRQHISSFIVDAGNLVRAWAATKLMQQSGVPVTVITGPVVNNDTGVKYASTQGVLDSSTSFQSL